MQLNPPPKVRQAIYAFATVAIPTMTYLNSQNVVSDFWFGLFSVVTAAVTGLATVNVSRNV